MEFFTRIDIAPFRQKIDHSQHIFTTGSCFAQNIAQRLLEEKFRVCSAPTGILFNPESIAHSIDMLDGCHTVTDKELHQGNGVWFNYDFHSSFSATAKDAAIKQMQQAIKEGSEALKKAEVVIITFGTAWVYRLLEKNRIVANCHKQPHALFSRELLTVEAIVERWSRLLDTTLKDKRVIFTISPIRHLSDGMEQNSLSKATLRIAIAELASRFDAVQYFPAYEIMNDELRDYRFYAEDMVHPSALAVDYIWQRFSQAAFTKECLDVIERVKKITQAAAHRPLNPQSESHRAFCLKQIAEIEKFNVAHPEIDLSDEKAIFLAHL